MMHVRWRSLLFAAADDQKRLAKIAARGADAVILDLEDAVPADRKAAARTALPLAVAALDGLSIVIRVNASWTDVMADLAVAVQPGVAAIMVPKVETAARLVVIGEMVAEYAAAAGLTEKPGLIALIESPAGISQLEAIAAVDGVIGLALGSEDFSLALGVAPTPEALDLPCRMLALAAASRGVMALGLPVSIGTIDDEGAWAAAIVRGRSFGLTGALCIHPLQVGPVNGGFAPTDAECAAAEHIVAAWDASPGAGVLLVDGRMVDRPVMLAARRTLAMATRQIR